MSDISLELEFTDEARVYRPGDMLRGYVRWSSQESPRFLAVQLVWSTEGRGDRDAAAVVRRQWENPGAIGEQQFELVVPAGPITYHGKLISIVWSVEAVTERPDGFGSAEVTISPTGAPLTVGPISDVDETAGGIKRFLGGLK